MLWESWFVVVWCSVFGNCTVNHGCVMFCKVLYLLIDMLVGLYVLWWPKVFVRDNVIS